MGDTRSGSLAEPRTPKCIVHFPPVHEESTRRNVHGTVVTLHSSLFTLHSSLFTLHF